VKTKNENENGRVKLLRPKHEVTKPDRKDRHQEDQGTETEALSVRTHVETWEKLKKKMNSLYKIKNNFFMEVNLIPSSFD
jgi:hypothetical protein